MSRDGIFGRRGKVHGRKLIKPLETVWGFQSKLTRLKRSSSK